MTAYPRYRNTGLEWLPEIPEHWSVRKLKEVATVSFSSVDKKVTEGEETVSLCNYTDVYYNDYITPDLPFMQATASRQEISRFRLRPGDVIITKDSETPDDIAVPAFVSSDVDAVCGYHLALIRTNPKLLDGHYTFLSFLASGIKEQFEAAATGITRYGLGKYDIENARVFAPRLPEQRAIARFLDYKTRQIDTFIRKKQRLIELLKEERAAIINQAVTRGIDPDVAMKDSGIEWLGEVPAHWNIIPLKRALSRSDYGVSERLTGDGPVKVLTMAHIQDAEIIVPQNGSLESVPEALILHHGDLLFNRTNSLDHVAKVGIFRGSSEDLVSFASYLVRLRANEKSTSDYLHFLLNSSWFLAEARKIAIPSINQANLNPTRYGNIKTCLPPVDEQGAIVRYLRDKCGVIQQSILNTEREIALIQEYRTALISEAVTGKIDVRGYSDRPTPTDNGSPRMAEISGDPLLEEE